jgi:hypothetical protein
MKFKSIIAQKKYYSENTVSDLITYPEIEFKLGHFQITNDLEGFSNLLKECDSSQINTVFKYFQDTDHNICLYKIISKLLTINPIINATSAKKVINEFNLTSSLILNSSIQNIQKNALLYYLNETLINDENLDINELIQYFDDMSFINKMIPISADFYVKNLLDFPTGIKSIYIGCLEKVSINDKLNAIRSMDQSDKILGFFSLDSKKFKFNFKNNKQEVAFVDLSLKYIIDENNHALKLELELVGDSNNVEIDAELVSSNDVIFAELASNEESFILSAKDSFIYSMSELVTKTIKVLNHPYTKLAIAGIVIGGGLLHSTDVMAGTDDHSQLTGHPHLSESDISGIMSHTPYIAKAKSLMFGNMGHATQAGVDLLHQKAMWKSLEEQFHKLGIDINELQAKHFNKMNMHNRFEWSNTNSGYELHGGGLVAKFKLDNHHYIITDLLDEGKGEIVPKDVFTSWANKICDRLNEAHSQLHDSESN